MRFLIIFIFLITNSYANEVLDIKNLIINKELKNYDSITFLDTKNTQLDLKDFPNDTAASSSLGPFTVNTSTKKIDTRARARFISLKVSTDSTSQFWKLGTFRIDYFPDGRR